MKQSTTFAQVATNLLNLLQGYTKGIRFLLVMFLTLTASTAWGAEGDIIKSFDCSVSSATTYARYTPTCDDIKWNISWGQTNYIGTNKSGNFGNLKITNNTDLNAAKGVNSSVNTSSQGYVTIIPQSAMSRVGKITISCTALSGSPKVYVVSSTSLSTSYSQIKLKTGNGLSAQGATMSTSGLTFEFDTQNQETYYAVVLYSTAWYRLTNTSIEFIEGASAPTCTPLEMSTVTATPGDSKITLTWSAVDNASNYTVTCSGGTVGSVTGESTKTCTITGLTNGTSYKWSVMPVGNGTIYCEENTPATGSTTPNATYSITYHDKDGAHTVDALGGSALLEVLPNNPTSCDIDIYPYFVGWSTTDIPSGGTTEQPTLVSAEIVNSTTASKTYYAVWSDVDPNAGGESWEKATSISVGDKVVFVHEEKKRELTGIASNIGTATERTKGIPDGIEGTYVLTVEAGTANNSYSFKNGNIYLSWSSGNNLYTSNTKNNASSWTINTSTGGDFKFANVGTTSRILQFNSSSPRWACYTSSQSAFQIYKQSTAAGTATYITTCTTKPTYSVTSILSHVTAAGGNPITVTSEDEDLTLTYLPEDTWNLPATISVTMGGAPLSSETDYDWDNGDLLIAPASGFTGDIVVTINGWKELAPPTELNVDNITSNSADLSWTIDPDAESYTINILGENDPAAEPVRVIEGITTNSYTLADLNAETEYLVGLVAVGDGTTYIDSQQECFDVFTTAPSTCTVTYDANGGEGTVIDTKSPYDNGETVTIVGNYGKLTKDGYAFTGWNTAADGTGTPYKNGDTFTVTGNTTLYAQWCEAYWKLVTDASELEDDTRIIIAAKDYNVALSKMQNNAKTNRVQVEIIKQYNTIDFGNEVQTLTLVEVLDDYFALYTGLDGFLYAASSNANELKTGTNNNGNGNWDIVCNEEVSYIAAKGTSTHNQLKYNSSSSLFSCYAEGNSQKDVVIYKEVCKQDSYNVTSTLTNATAANGNPTTVSATATSLTLNYTANTGYLLPETITVKMGGATLVSGTDYIWNQETGELTITVTGFYGDIDVKIVAEEDPCYTFTMSEVTATSTTNSITLTWTEVAGATGYKVRLDEGEFTNATGLTHTFESLSPKTTYNWEVQAVKDGANFHCEASQTGSTITQKETFTVSWSVNDNVTSTESVVDGDYITEYPSDPSAPSGCHEKVFVGWTNTPINTPTNKTPATLYKQKSDVPAITDNTILHAVWADEKTTEGEEVEVEKIASVNISDYASVNNWNNGTQYTTVNIDKNITATAATTGANTGKYYASGNTWRFYQSDNGKLTINAADGCTIKTIKVTYTVDDSGVLTYNSSNKESGSEISINATSANFGVGNTNSATNGKVLVTAISVTYTTKTKGPDVITHSAYTTLCDECTPSESLVLAANASTADLDINGEAIIAFSTTGGNGDEIVYAANPKSGVTWDNGIATFTKAGDYTITASQGKNGEYCPTTSNTLDVTITAIPHLYFTIEPNPTTIVFDPVECGGNTRVEDKKSVSVQAYNLAAAVTAQVTGPYKIARTSGATLNEYSTTLTLRNNKSDGKINGDDDVVYILSFPPAGSSEPTTGTLTFTTTNGNTLTVNLSTPTITCTPRTLTFNDRGIKTTQEYYAGTEVPEPATPTGVCGEYEFDGWALSRVESGSTTYEKVEFPYIMPANNQTVLHAVYKYTEGPTNQYELVTEIESGKDYVIAAYADTDYALTNQEDSQNEGKFISESVECDANDIITTDNANIIWKVTGNDEDGYKFYNSAVDKYLEMYRTGGKSILRLVDDCTNPFAIDITIKDGNLYVGVTSPNIIDNYNVFSFYNNLYNAYKSCDYNIYFYKQTATTYYTTTPDCHPSVTLISDGEVYVTATNGRGIMAATPLTLTTTDLAPNTEIAISSNSGDIYFSTERNTNFAMAQVSQPKTSLTLTTNEGGELEKPLYIHYKPSADGNGTPAEVVVTADVSTHNPPFTAQKTIHVRNLPAKFVIATKAGATWYALPANMSGATNPAAVVIEVDETTMTATAPNTTPYTLWPVATINGNTDRYKEFGEHLRFAAVNNGNKGLWANNADKGTTINNNGAIVARGDNPGAAYEWKVTTTVVDGNWQYTLYSDQENNKNHLCYSMNQPTPAWGTYASNEAKYQLYFLPIKAETTPFDYQVVEWYPNKVLIQTSTTFSSLTAKIAGEKINNVTFERKDANQYEVTGLPLMENPAKALTLEFVANEATHSGTHTIPVMISGGEHSISGLSEITKGVYNYTNLVVRDNAKLTIDGTAATDNTFYDVTIYPTAKIVVPEEKQLSVHRLTFIGGITEVYDGSKYTLNKYGVPELSLKGKLGKTVTTMDYVMRVDLDQMYQMGVPYDVNLGEITYWDGSAIELGDELYVSAYDGQARANRESKTWLWETEFAEPTLKAGVGYTISAEPQTNADKYAILRLPMKSNISSGSTEAAKTVAVKAYDNEKGVTITDNHKGWNYLSNPYMTTISGGEADTKLVLGYLKETGTGPWEWVETTQRYVTIPHDNGQDYYQMQFSNAVLKPFKSFFVQIAEAGELSFALASRQNAPARYMEVQTEQEVEFEILLSNEKQSDNTGLLIAEKYSPAYEINADLEKMIGSMSVYSIYNGYNLAYNAINPTNAQDWIPIGYSVPDVGEYTFSLDEDVDLESVEHIYLIDYETSEMTDLVEYEYTFQTSEKKNDARFAIQVRLSQKHDNTTTVLDNLNATDNKSSKFIYNEQLYILRNGNIYDATGQFITTINK